MAHGYDRESVAMARLWSAHYLENDGDPERALEEATRGLALVEDSDGPWIRAMMHSVAGGLNAQLGKRAEAAQHARQAIPILDQLEANDDGIQARSLIAGHAIAEGRFDEAERLIAEIERLTHERTGFGGAFVIGTVRAELALAQGDIEEGLRLYRVAGKELAAITLPGMELTGLEPWSLFGEAAGATAYALHGTGQEGADLFEALRTKAPEVLERGPAPDGLPGRRHGPARTRHLGAAEAGDRPARTPSGSWCLPSCSPTRSSPPPWTPSGPRTRPSGSRQASPPGSAAEYGERKGPDLLPEARAVAERIAGCRELHLAAVASGPRAAGRPPTTTAQPSSAQPTWAVTWPSLSRSRTAVTMWLTGLMFTKVWSQPGRVSAGTKALDRKVSGNMIIIEMPCTAWALRATVPS